MSPFNKAAWDGTARLVEPPEPTPFGVGDLVACIEPVDDKGDPVVRGVIVDVEPSADGEALVRIAREIPRTTVGGFREVRLDFVLMAVDAMLLDRRLHVPSTPFNRRRSNAAAARIALAVGARKARGGDWNDDDRALLGSALVLASLSREVSE